MSSPRTSLGELFRCFLKLGCISFGGPVAHLGFFQTEFVQRRKWMTDEDYADLVALCQFLPGPASSQVGFAIGLRRGGLAGAMVAWIGFTLPSAVLMIGFALGLATVGDVGTAGWLVGLKLAAVAVVAQALWGMAEKLCPDRQRALIALIAAAALMIAQGAIWQVIAIISGALLGWALYSHKIEPGDSPAEVAPTQVGATSKAWRYLGVFAVGLLGLPVLARFTGIEFLGVFDGFYRAGSLVFGGGHVVLPLLDSFTVGRGWVGPDTFLAGYGAAQALPGPLFAFSAFLGSSLSAGPGGVTGGVIALVAIYLPSWLLILGAMPYWEKLRHLPTAQAALRGANAVVVGLLLAAFYSPIWVAGITGPYRLAFALVAFGALRFGKVPPWALVLACGVAGAVVF